MMAEIVKLKYKSVKTFRDRINYFMDDHVWVGPFLFITLYIFSMIGIFFGSYYTSKTLSTDVTTSVPAESVKKYMVIIEKNNGLTDTLFLSTNDTISTSLKGEEGQSLILTEKGKNSIGINIDNDYTVENVKSYSIKLLK